MHPPDARAAYTERGQEASPGSPDDATLLARMSAGDEKALGTFYDRWEHAVRTVAVRVTGDSTEAEDVVEDVFWQAWRQASRFDASRGGAGTWVLTIARSRALDRVRAMRRSREDAGLDSLEEGNAAAVSVEGGDPLDDIERGVRSRMVHEALRALPKEQRETLELAYFEGLSQTEIAERTGQPLGTVKTRARLAMQKLRESLADLKETT